MKARRSILFFSVAAAVAAAAACAETAEVDPASHDGGDGGRESSTTTPPPPPGPPGEAGPGAADGGADAAGGIVIPEGAGLCNPSSPIDATRYAYRGPKIAPNACSSADVDDLVAYAREHPSAGINELIAHAKSKYSAACNECIAGPATDATWTPFLLAANGTLLSVNQSGCVELASGKGEGCGRAHRQFDQCIDEGCRGCDAGADRQSCRSAIQGGACKAASEGVVGSCGTGVNEFIEACRRFDSWLRRHCVSGS